MPRLSSWTIAVVGIGLAAGVFAALFGVGGGIVVVPLLVVLLGFPPKAAASTSLAAIAITAGFGAIVYSVLGRVHWDDAALIGLPAVLGGLIGTGVQSRISSRALTILFALFIVAIAVRLLIE